MRQILFVSCVWFCTSLSPVTAEDEPVTVLQVIDGDTCVLEDGRHLRYLGIDAPEEGDPKAREATLTHNVLAGGKSGRLEIGRPSTDRNGRVLGYLFIDETLVNEALLERGFAHLRRPLAARYRERLYQAQEAARAAGRGIWERAREYPVTVRVVHADARGDDRRNLNDEYVVIRNTGNNAMDLTGWTVSDEANHTYLFPSFMLAPDAEVTLRTGFGKNTATLLHWGSRRPIWNNRGDTVFLRDAGGYLIYVHVY